MRYGLKSTIIEQRGLVIIAQAVRDLALRNEAEFKLVKWMVELSIAVAASGFALVAKMLLELAALK
jgi:hypothetical protein